MEVSQFFEFLGLAEAVSKLRRDEETYAADGIDMSDAVLRLLFYLPYIYVK